MKNILFIYYFGNLLDFETIYNEFIGIQDWVDLWFSCLISTSSSIL